MSTHALPSNWLSLPDDLREVAITAESREYGRARSSYMKVGSPNLVLKARTAEDAAAIVRYASAVRSGTENRVPFSVRSGGHGIAGTSTNDAGVILDLSRLADIRVIDPNAGIVQAQAGAIWGDVALVLEPHDLALTSGNFGDTGVGGLATAGGVGYFARSQGLTIDHIVAAKLHTADGEIRWVDAARDPDLFWAIRGG